MEVIQLILLKICLKQKIFNGYFQMTLLNNWLAYGGGVLGTILVVMLGVGLAEESGLLSTLIKKGWN